MQEIYDNNELDKEMLDENTFGISMKLDRKQIEEWKTNGKFKYLKRELLNLPNAKFCCIDNGNNTYKYVFMTHSQELSLRILNLLNYLRSNTKMPLTKCKIDEGPFNMGRYQGTGNVTICNLF